MRRASFTSRERVAARGLGLLGAVTLLALWIAAAAASQVDIARLERELMNPCENCGGKPLAGSYCGGATEAKEKLRAMAERGMNEEEIKAAFVAEYGEWILALPERSGFNLFAWILPVVGIVLGGGGLALFLRRTNEARRRAEEAARGLAGTSAVAAPDVEIHGEARPARGSGDLEDLRRRLAREVQED